MRDLFAGFDSVDLKVADALIHARVGGSGPPVLLLHGYPQTHAMWHAFAAPLAQQRTVVAADLRGYGDSTTDSDDFTFRAMAADQRTVMSRLGFPQFHLVGHDRGARVAHRLTLDHPEVVRSLTLLDILPTLDVWRLMNDWLMLRYYHWSFLAQGDGLPETLINADPEFFVRRTLGGLGGATEIFASDALDAYLRAAGKPEVVRAWCADYRAAAGPDLEIDRDDRDTAVELPALVLWGTTGVVGAQEDPVRVWRRHFPWIRGHAVEAGHFLVEENLEPVLGAVADHLRGAESTVSPPIGKNG